MTSKPKHALGKGLKELMGERPAPKGQPLFINIDSVISNPDQPRKYFNSTEMERLVESIKLKGILEPLIVRATNSGYQLIAGQRRLIAAKSAELKEVPVIIRDVPDSPRERLELALIENIIRDDLNPIEEAEAVVRLKDEMQQPLQTISKLIGKDRSTVSGIIRLLTLPESIKDDIRFKRISAGHGRAILAIDDKERWEEARSLVIANALTVRETEALAKKWNKGKKKKDPTEKDSSVGDAAYYESLEKNFTDALGGLKVKIKFRGKGKKIEIHYKDNKQIENIMTKLGIVAS
ncbi:MAG: ParB/RepB/Spo0J family partition protein [Deltaproteobacteria bacterium]|jgi:ParB family chromosome partitioning protein|nr:ParB/RepB/Spo0J family partition protein [Deltaproteobacteria bacterium]